MRRLATKFPWLVRESAAMTTPPSNLAATSVVACDPPVDKIRDNHSLTAAEAAPTLKTQRMSSTTPHTIVVCETTVLIDGVGQRISKITMQRGVCAVNNSTRLSRTRTDYAVTVLRRYFNSGSGD